MNLTEKEIAGRAEEAIRQANGEWAEARKILAESAAADPKFRDDLMERIIDLELRAAATRLGESTKKCRYCAEIIALDAAKCKYCGEWVEEAHSFDSVPVAPPKPASGAPIIRHFTLLTGWVLIVLIVILIVTFTKS